MRKALTVSVILLFLGLAIQPTIATEQTETEIDIEPKDYLFQTIIDIANNPEVKELLEQYDNDMFKVNIDRSIYRKLLLSNPRLMVNTLFTKPSMSVEYLNNCYNKGIEITDVLGEDKVLEIIENVEVTDTKLFDELDNIITNNGKLSSRLETLKEMNKELNTVTPYEDNPIICSIASVLMFSAMIVLTPLEIFLFIINGIFKENSGLRDIFTNLILIISLPSAIVFFCGFVLFMEYCIVW